MMAPPEPNPDDLVIPAEKARSVGVEVVRRPDGSQVMVIPAPPEGDANNQDGSNKGVPRPKEGTSLGYPAAP